MAQAVQPACSTPAAFPRRVSRWERVPAVRGRPLWRRAEQPVLLRLRPGRHRAEVAPDHIRGTRPEDHPPGPPGLDRAREARGQASLDGQDPAVQVRQPPQYRQLAPPCPAVRSQADQHQRLPGGERPPGASRGARSAAERIIRRRDGVTVGSQEAAHLSWPRWRRCRGRGGPRIPASGLSRSRPSATAQDTALRMRSQRAGSLGTGTPRHQRQMAARITAGVSDCSRQRHSRSPGRAETT